MPSLDGGGVPLLYGGYYPADNGQVIIESTLNPLPQRGFLLQADGTLFYKGSLAAASDGGQARIYYDYDGVFVTPTSGAGLVLNARKIKSGPMRLYHPNTTGIEPTLQMGSRNGLYDAGLSFGTASVKDGFMTAGGYYSSFSGGWVATGTESTTFRLIDSAFRWYLDTGLTVGSTFVQTERMALSPSLLQIEGETRIGGAITGNSAYWRFLSDPTTLYGQAAGSSANIDITLNTKGTGGFVIGMGNTFRVFGPTFAPVLYVDNNGTSGSVETSIATYHNAILKRIKAAAVNAVAGLPAGARCLYFDN